MTPYNDLELGQHLGQAMCCWCQAIARTKAEMLCMGTSVILKRIPQPLVTKICLKFFNLEFQLYFREVKELKQFL